MIRPPMLEVINGEYELVEQCRPRWRIWLRRVVGYGGLCIVLWLAWLVSGW